MSFRSSWFTLVQHLYQLSLIYSYVISDNVVVKLILHYAFAIFTIMKGF